MTRILFEREDGDCGAHIELQGDRVGIMQGFCALALALEKMGCNLARLFLSMPVLTELQRAEIDKMTVINSGIIQDAADAVKGEQ